jgi:hypothetical protein
MFKKTPVVRVQSGVPSRMKWAAVGAACAALLLIPGCSVDLDPGAGTGGAGASSVNPAGLTPPMASGLIRSHEQFREAIYIEVVSKGATSTSEFLETEGLVAFTDRKKELFSLTPKARSLGAMEVPYRVDAPILMFPVSRRELVEVSAIEELPMLGDSRRLIFTYRESPNGLGRTLSAAGWDMQQVKISEARQGKALVGLYEDGWRIEMITL